MTKSDTSVASAVLIMDGDAIRRALRRIAHEIVERNPDLKRVVLAGIPSRGNEIARRIADTISVIEETNIDVGTIDVAMHRDDVGTRSELSSSSMTCSSPAEPSEQRWMRSIHSDDRREFN